jgi:hypothetical protein
MDVRIVIPTQAGIHFEVDGRQCADIPRSLFEYQRAVR